MNCKHGYWAMRNTGVIICDRYELVVPHKTLLFEVQTDKGMMELIKNGQLEKQALVDRMRYQALEVLFQNSSVRLVSSKEIGSDGKVLTVWGEDHLHRVFGGKNDASTQS